MTTSNTITVPANPDADDCLAAAAEAYAAQHPELVGWDLAPRWTDNQRETVTLTVPGKAFDRDAVDNQQIRDLWAEAKAHGDARQAELCERALDGDGEAAERCIDAIEEAFHRSQS